MAPSLDSRSLRDLRVEAGERVKFCLPFVGEPQPEVTWVKEGEGDSSEAIQPNRAKAIALTTTAEETKLVFNNISKAQEGTYVVTAENPSGKDSAKVSVTVLDRPTPPESLIATPEENNACALLWKRSKDDGGAPIEYYQVKKLFNFPKFNY